MESGVEDERAYADQEEGEGHGVEVAATVVFLGGARIAEGEVDFPLG